MKNFNDFNKLNEYFDINMTEDELLEMSNFWGDKLGLDENIVLWIGSSKSSKHGPRIKVSNLPKKMGNNHNTFSITIPNLKIIGDVNKKHINSKKLNNILDFIKLNEKILIQICNEDIDIVEFLTNMEKLQNKKIMTLKQILKSNSALEIDGEEIDINDFVHPEPLDDFEEKFIINDNTISIEKEIIYITKSNEELYIYCDINDNVHGYVISSD